MPEDYKLFFPVHRKKCVREEDIPKKPSLILEKVPSIVKEEPIFRPKVSVEEIIEPTIMKEPDLIEKIISEVSPEEMKEIIIEEKEEIEEKIEVEETMVFDEEEEEEEEVEPSDVVHEDEDEEEATDISKMEAYTEVEAN